MGLLAALRRRRRFIPRYVLSGVLCLSSAFAQTQYRKRITPPTQYSYSAFKIINVALVFTPPLHYIALVPFVVSPITKTMLLNRLLAGCSEQVDFEFCDDPPHLTFSGEAYSLTQMHIHSPSEHMVRGEPNTVPTRSADEKRFRLF